MQLKRGQPATEQALLAASAVDVLKVADRGGVLRRQPVRLRTGVGEPEPTGIRRDADEQRIADDRQRAWVQVLGPDQVYKGIVKLPVAAQSGRNTCGQSDCPNIGVHFCITSPGRLARKTWR